MTAKLVEAPGWLMEKSYPQKGEATPQFEVDGPEGQRHATTSTFQVAKVSKTFRSVSMICDAGFDVLFTETEASVQVPSIGKVVCMHLREVWRPLQG